MKRFFLILILAIIGNVSNGSANQDSLAHVTETLILNHKLDSAKWVVSNMDSNDINASIFLNVIQKGTSFRDYRLFTMHVFNSKRSEVKLLSEFLDERLVEPKGEQEINYDYVVAKWCEITWLLDENIQEKSAEKQVELENYIAKFNQNDRDVKRAKILSNSYHLVMCQIQGTFERSKKLCLDDEKIAREIKDTNLIVQSLYFYSDYLINSNNLDGFIDVMEQALYIDSLASNRSFYYSGVITHLINAYLFKGGMEEESLVLLNKLFYSSNHRVLTYSYFPGYVGTLNIPSAESDAVFSQFGVSDLNSFAEKIVELTKGVVNEKELYFVSLDLSSMFEKQGDLETAILYMRDANVILKKTYSAELGQSLARYETNLLKQKQKSELSKEQDKTQMYLIIMILSGVLVLVLVLYFLLKKNKEKELIIKNKEITIQRDAIKKKDEEKALLLKEIHHRVKNNFQVVSSLLELQSAGIKDEKAKALAIEGKTRINSMALIHKNLYENDDLQMFFDEYVEKLVTDLARMYGYYENAEITINVPHISFDIDTAIPLGLVINELVSNSFKYGMTNENPKMEVSIQETESNLYLLNVRDNGIGLPSDFSMSKLSSLGLQLVKGLSRQLMGEFTFDNQDGAQFFVSFKNIVARRTKG